MIITALMLLALPPMTITTLMLLRPPITAAMALMTITALMLARFITAPILSALFITAATATAATSSDGQRCFRAITVGKVRCVDQIADAGRAAERGSAFLVDPPKSGGQTFDRSGDPRRRK